VAATSGRPPTTLTCFVFRPSTAAPPQNVKTEVVMAFGLGPVLANANGAAPIPSCYASGSKSLVSAEAWQP
jgi:hypothetical protein